MCFAAAHDTDVSDTRFERTHDCWHIELVVVGQNRHSISRSKLIAELVERSAGRVTLVAGGGVRAHNVVDLVAATGVTDGDLLKGVQYQPNVCMTQSLVMRSRSGTVRLVNARHAQDKLAAMGGLDYG